MTPEALDFLESGAADAPLTALAEADTSDRLGLVSVLRKHWQPWQAVALAEQLVLRRQAAAKFGADAARLFFTRDALEQASDPLIRRWRAAQVSGHAIDAGCGIGADSLALAQAGCTVLGLDLDPLRVRLAHLNAERLGVAERARFAQHDITTGLPELCDWAFFDPARRDAHGRRLHGVEAYLPPLSTVRGWPDAARVMVKVSPAVEIAQVRPYDGALSFVSAGGDLKEAVLVLGDGARPDRAVLCLPDGAVLTWDAHPLDSPAPVRAPSGYLVEPDPALIRAGLVQHAAHAWDAAQLDPTIAYLTSDIPPRTPWARAWRIEAAMPFQLKRLKAYLSERGVGEVTVKKRGHPMTPEELLRALKPRGDAARTVVLTRHAGAPYMLVCDPQPVR